MQRVRQSIAALCLCGSMISAANATLIVDTGPGAGSDNLVLGRIQSLAGQFTTTQAWSIDSIEGWIGGGGSGDAFSATVAIYSDAESLPGLALYSEEFSTSAPGTAAWQGSSALGWFLPAGTYWTVFEVLPGQTLEGAMPGPVASPLPLAYSLSLNNYEWLLGDSSIGVRIDASATVPAPATPFLVGLALLALGGIRKRAALSR